MKCHQCKQEIGNQPKALLSVRYLDGRVKILHFHGTFCIRNWLSGNTNDFCLGVDCTLIKENDLN